MPVATAILRGEADSQLLYGAEAAACARCAPRRLSEFTAGRLCARRALDELGVTAVAITMNPDRSPHWPPGIVGSISHTAGFACAVVARSASARSVGVDAETVGRVTRDVESRIFTAREASFLSDLSGIDRERAATIVFGAKEAFYKCQHPVTRKWLDFHDVSIELATGQMTSGDFSVHAASSESVLLAEWIALPLRGKFRVIDDVALTGIALTYGD